MIKKLRQKLREEKSSIKKFIKEYLPNHSYSAVVSQLNYFNKLQPEVEKAIKTYLER